MANTITILVEHDDINYYKDKLKYFDREVVLKALGLSFGFIFPCRISTL